MEVQYLDVSVLVSEGSTTVVVRGELDLASAGKLNEVLRKILEQGETNLVLDMENISYIDSEGIKVLLRVERELYNRGGSITISKWSRVVTKALHILGLDRLYEPSISD